MLGNDFKTFLITPIPDKTLQALCFHISTLEYLKDRALYFKDITDADNLTLSLNTELDCKSEQNDQWEKEEDNGCPKVTNSKEKAVKKKNKHVKKKKAQLASFYARVQLNFYCPESALSHPLLISRSQSRSSCPSSISYFQSWLPYFGGS